MKYQAIIVAGGSGKRMQEATPKQFLKLCGKPILMHTLERFYEFCEDIELIVVLPESEMERWQMLCKEHNFSIAHTCVCGGKERFFSVKNALAHTDRDALVAIHDGVRPLVQTETIARCYAKAAQTGAAIPVMPLVDSLRKWEGDETVAQDRAQYCLVQTPQVFKGTLIQQAYDQVYTPFFTDDASVVEHAGHGVRTVAGNAENIKITNRTDLLVATALMQTKE